MSVITRPTWDTTSDLTLGLATGPLASDTNLLAGRNATGWDFSSTQQAFEILLNMRIRTGTSPTGGRLEVWPIAKMLVNAGNIWPDTITGTDGNITITSRNVLFGLSPRGRGPIAIPVDTTSNRDYFIANLSLADYFFGAPPMIGTIFVVHNTGVALNSTGSNHICSVTAKYITNT